MPEFIPVYHRPKVDKSKIDGRYHVLMWVRYRKEGDNDPENTYRRFEIIFDEKGNVDGNKPIELDTIVVNIKNRDLVH